MVEKISNKNILKKILLVIFMLALSFTIFSCGSKKVNYDADTVTLTKNFFNEYLKRVNKGTAEELNEIKSKYMTETLVEELTLRSWEMEADAVVGVSDPTGYKKYLNVVAGEDENHTIATFEVPNKNEGMDKDIYKINIHFRNVDDKKLMDTYDFTWTEVDAEGNESAAVYNTRYANKEVLSEDDRIAMSSIRKYYEEMAGDENK